jgi:hypothetical protein
MTQGRKPSGIPTRKWAQSAEEKLVADDQICLEFSSGFINHRHERILERVEMLVLSELDISVSRENISNRGGKEFEFMYYRDARNLPWDIGFEYWTIGEEILLTFVIAKGDLRVKAVCDPDILESLQGYTEC